MNPNKKVERENREITLESVAKLASTTRGSQLLVNRT